MQYVDEAVTRRKFEFELNQFKANQVGYRKRGIFLMDVNFPNIFIGFTAIQLAPPPLVFVVRLNFENYDMEPISVRFVNPFTFEPLQIFRIPFVRRIPNQVKPQNLIAQNKGKLPFFCIPGIREYHKHDGHTGDLWFLHRKRGGEGTMGFIIKKLYDYGITALDVYQINAVMDVRKLKMPHRTNNLVLQLESKNAAIKMNPEKIRL